MSIKLVINFFGKRNFSTGEDLSTVLIVVQNIITLLPDSSSEKLSVKFQLLKSVPVIKQRRRRKNFEIFKQNPSLVLKMRH